MRRLSAGTPHPVKCSCGGTLFLIVAHGKGFYGCENYKIGCASVASAHQTNYRPMTLPTCDMNIKGARGRAHAHFDELWRPDGSVFDDRRKAYEWLTIQRPKYIHWLAKDKLVHIGFLETVKEIEDVLLLCVQKKMEAA